MSYYASRRFSLSGDYPYWRDNLYLPLKWIVSDTAFESTLNGYENWWMRLNEEPFHKPPNYGH
jgi:hypothetical protein